MNFHNNNNNNNKNKLKQQHDHHHHHHCQNQEEELRQQQQSGNILLTECDFNSKTDSPVATTGYSLSSTFLRETFTYTWSIPNLRQYFRSKTSNLKLFSEKFPSQIEHSSSDARKCRNANNKLQMSFYLELLPDGEDENCGDFVSIFLYLASSRVSETFLHYRLSIIDDHGAVAKFEENQRIFVVGEGWGWREFISRDELLSGDNHILDTNKQHSLTILCEIGVIDENIEKNTFNALQNQKELAEKTKENIKMEIEEEDREDANENKRKNLLEVDADDESKASNSDDDDNYPDLPEFNRNNKKIASIGRLDQSRLSFQFDGSIYDAIDGRPIVIEDGKVDSMKLLWEYRKGKF